MELWKSSLMKQGRKMILIILVCIVTLGIAICIGSVSLYPKDILLVIGHKVWNLTLPETMSATKVSILWDIRIPREITAFLVGGALAVSGSVMQSILKNPLASSYTLGVSSGASLGAALVIGGLIQIPISPFFALPLVGFLFGLATVFVAIFLSNRFHTGLHSPTVILVGIVLSLFINAILTVISALKRDSMQQLINWQMGSFSSRGWSHVMVILPITIIATIFIFYFHKEMDILTFGTETAQTMGVNTGRVKFILLILSTILTGTAVCFTGVIGFVDLIAPHIVRKLFGPSHKYLIPMSILLGGAFMTISDTIARTILSPLELPVGAVTALIGAPFFAYIFFHKGGKG